VGATKTGPHQLTPRQREVLKLAAAGATHKQIANRLGVTSKTARNHLENLYQRLEVHSRAEAAIYAVRLGLVEAHEANASWTSDVRLRTIDVQNPPVRRRPREEVRSRSTAFAGQRRSREIQGVQEETT
jgi:DNA-binding CsgD family transcriptional regulator